MWLRIRDFSFSLKTNCFVIRNSREVIHHLLFPSAPSIDVLKFSNNHFICINFSNFFVSIFIILTICLYYRWKILDHENGWRESQDFLFGMWHIFGQDYYFILIHLIFYRLISFFTLLSSPSFQSRCDVFNHMYFGLTFSVWDFQFIF